MVTAHMPQTPEQQRRTDRFFKISVTLKGIASILEIMAGIAVLFVPWSDVSHWLIVIAQGHLVNDPDDFIFLHIVTLAQQMSVARSTFFALYLLSRGVVKFGLVIALLKRYLWAYPLSIAIIGAAMLYQIWLVITAHSVVQGILTVLDIVVVWFVWKEWLLLKEHKETGAPPIV